MMEFWAALLHCGLVDLGFWGNIFTWNNGCLGDAFVQKRLDRDQNGDLFFPMQRSFTSNLPILVIIWYLSIYPCLTKYAGRKNYQEGLRKSGHSMKGVKRWFGLLGRPRMGLVALCFGCLRRLDDIGKTWLSGVAIQWGILKQKYKRGNRPWRNYHYKTT